MNSQPVRSTVSPEPGLRLAQLVIDEAARNPWLASLLMQRKPDWVTRLAAAARRLWSLPRQLRRDLWRKLASGLTAAALLLALNPPIPVMAATITVTPGAVGIFAGDGCSLVEAIYAAEGDISLGECIAGSGADIITLPANSTFSYTATYDGTYGFSIFEITSDITIEGNGSTIERNSGAVDNFRIFFVELDGSLTLNHVTLTGGITNDGGAIRSAGNLTINDSTITGNTANFRGGGVFMAPFPSRDLTITNSTISNNTVGILGGGGAYIQNARFDLANSTISGNLSSGPGGGLKLFGSTTTIYNSTITANDAGSNNGGGIHNGGSSSATYLSRSIVSGNSAYYGEEIHVASGATISMGDNLLGHSGLSNGLAFNGFTPDLGDFTATTNGNTPTALASILNTTLADNGGPTETHALVLASPAIDQITPSGGDPFCMDDGTSTDQRGGVRADGVGRGGAACDIGAYEYGSAETPTALTLASFSAATPLGWVATAGAAVLATIGAGWLALRRRFGR